MSDLTPKQRMFVAEYLANGMNATKSAESAGYSKKTAYSIGQENLNKPEIQKAIEKKHGPRLQKLEITADRVLRELALMGFANMRDYMTLDGEGRLTEFDYGNMTRDQAAAIQELTVDTTGGAGDGERKLVLRTKLKLASKRESLELLGKHLKLFTDKLEVSGDAALIERLLEGRKRASKKE